MIGASKSLFISIALLILTKVATPCLKSRDSHLELTNITLAEYYVVKTKNMDKLRHEGPEYANHVDHRHSSEGLGSSLSIFREACHWRTGRSLTWIFSPNKKHGQRERNKACFEKDRRLYRSRPIVAWKMPAGPLPCCYSGCNCCPSPLLGEGTHTHTLVTCHFALRTSHFTFDTSTYVCVCVCACPNSSPGLKRL